MTSLPQPRPFPRLGRLGVAVMVIGFGLDLVAHTLLPQALVAGTFSPQQHAAHLVVLIGMVLVILAVVVDGQRHAGGRPERPERRPRDAVR